MDRFRISCGASGNRPKVHGPDEALLPILCATVLLIAASPLAAMAPPPGGISGQPSALLYRTTVGDPVQGKRVVEAKCAVCHGADGNSTDPNYPKLAGQNPAYLYWQLWAFKSGTRRSDVMSGVAADLSDADAADVASFYGRQRAQPDPVKNKSLASAGERIFFAGVDSGMTPPCAMCHGSGGRQGMPMMMGRMPMMGMMGQGMMGSGATSNPPNLDGQHATYILDQLNRFADGGRPGSVMARIATFLSVTDRKAVAEFLSGRP